MVKKIPHFFPKIIIFMLLTGIGQLHAITNNTISDKVQAKPNKDGGLYVSNTAIYISNNSTIIIPGNLTLKNSVILGNGKVLLKSNHRQIICSTSSAISNLEINNPTSVLLLGDLAVLENLTVKKGIFNISKGTLIINSDNLYLLEGGSIFKGKQLELSISYPLSLLTAQPLLLQGNLKANLNSTSFADFFYKKTATCFKEIMHHKATIIPFFQPPKKA